VREDLIGHREALIAGLAHLRNLIRDIHELVGALFGFGKALGDATDG